MSNRPVENPDLLRAAMEVVLTWGPERSRSEADRLADVAEGAARDDPARREQALAEAHAVMAEAESLAPSIKGTGPAPTSRAAILEAHPWLSDEQLDRAIQQGLHFHWRDTGM